MASPLYFFPRVARSAFAVEDKPNREILAARGLDDVLGDLASLESQTCFNELRAKGPGGHSGVLLSVNPPGGRAIGKRVTGYYPDFQDWHHMVDAGDVQLWIGLDKEEPPAPGDLARPNQHDGRKLELGDGREWLIPIVRRPDDTTELPQDMGWDRQGQYVETIKAPYRPIFEEAAEAIEWFLDGVIARALMPRALELCLRGLGLNYRVGRHEQQLLKLVDTTNYMTLLAWMVDLPLREAWLEAEKKRREAIDASRAATSGNTSPGSEG